MKPRKRTVDGMSFVQTKGRIDGDGWFAQRIKGEPGQSAWVVFVHDREVYCDTFPANIQEAVWLAQIGFSREGNR